MIEQEEIGHLKKEEIKGRGSSSLNIDSTSTPTNTVQHDSERKYKQEGIKYTKVDWYVLISILSSIGLYILSLEGCHNTQTYCLVNLNPLFFYLLGLYLAGCAMIVVIFVTMLIKKKIVYFHWFYAVPLYIYILYFHDIGSDLSHHGAYNKMIFFFLCILFSVFMLIFLGILYLKRQKYNKVLAGIAISVIFVIAFTSFKLRYGCHKWINGLNGMKIDNSPKSNKCYIIQPNKCWVNMWDGWFDVSWIWQEDCNNFRTGERQELIKYWPSKFKNTFNFGYPITTNYTWWNASHFDRFFNNVMTDFIDWDKDNYYNMENKPEVLLKFNQISELGKIEFKINKNEKVIKERDEVYNRLKEDEKPKYKNFLFIYIDALSRAHFIRKMKHTIEFLYKYFDNDKENKVAFQMMKYHAFIYFTPPNVNPMFYGESMQNSNGTNIIRAFKERGFITGQSNNICSREWYDLEDDYTKDMDFEDFDHENIAMFCDPNFFNYENPFTPYLGPYSIKRRCWYGRDTFDYVLDYGETFWDTYKDQRKFLRVAFQDAHEGTGEVVRYWDERLAVFLNSFWSKGYLEDTAIFMVSDHGNNMIGFYNIFQVEDFVMEKTLASWYIILPKKHDKDLENLRMNQQVMVTPYDIHDTMLDIIQFKEGSKYSSRNGSTIFKPINGLFRDCKTYELDWQDLWCRCINYQ